MRAPVRILARNPDGSDGWTEWRDPVDILATHDIGGVREILDRVEAANRRGLTALGYVGYEAGPAFDPRFRAHASTGGLPLVWFALFRHGSAFVPPDAPPTSGAGATWAPSLARPAYRDSIRCIKQHIAAGETYQVNFTLKLSQRGFVDAAPRFFAGYARQPSPYAMLIETPAFRIISWSPELFFHLADGVIRCEPMKGTCPRGPHPALDAERGRQLQASVKNRAENIMIVDMVRNDLGRIADVRSVEARDLFTVTPWPTLWQMTSTVTARTKAGLAGIFGALFPSASITGAPKLQTSGIIAELEPSPRGVYTGALGWSLPGGEARFSVAIRTAVQVEGGQRTEYGVGSGIVWDSSADEEYRECLLKGRMLERRPPPSFRLLETMRWDQGEGYRLLDGHLGRMAASATWFGFPFDEPPIRERLKEAASSFTSPHVRVRLLLDRKARLTVQHAPLPGPACWDPDGAATILAVIDNRRHDIESTFLYHKTTRRSIYARARARHPGADEVLLVNRNGALMEFTAGNLVVRTGGEWLTPSLPSGLLPGVFRDHLIAKGLLRETVLAIDDLATADALYFINSVRGWQDVQIAPPVTNRLGPRSR